MLTVHRKSTPRTSTKVEKVVEQTTRMTDFFAKVNKESAEGTVASVQGKEVQNVELEDGGN